MSKHQAEPNRHLASCVVLGVTLAISALPATASAGVAFTWDPAGASPPLAGAGSAFTADTIYGGHYLWSLGPAGPPTVAHPGRIFQVDFYEQVQQFSLGSGAPFVPTGLNGPEGAPGSYGLYVKMTVEVEQVGAPNIYDYHSLTMSLMADPGNNDGVLSATASGVGFANGTTGDITLAMGSLISSSFQLNPTTGIRSIGHFTESFQPSSGEGGFFVTPVSPYTVLEEFLTIPTMGPGAIQTMLDSSDPSSQYNWVNGATAVMDLRVPEPASVLPRSRAMSSAFPASHRAALRSAITDRPSRPEPINSRDAGSGATLGVSDRKAPDPIFEAEYDGRDRA